MQCDDTVPQLGKTSLRRFRNESVLWAMLDGALPAVNGLMRAQVDAGGEALVDKGRADAPCFFQAGAGHVRQDDVVAHDAQYRT